ncbi:MAG: hypothetical protein IJ044_03610, partial [Oscillospiraceae bacterium]|nr:hypothetical protein [Oscillospiraceae bacterium]
MGVFLPGGGIFRFPGFFPSLSDGTIFRWFIVFILLRFKSEVFCPILCSGGKKIKNLSHFGAKRPG